MKFKSLTGKEVRVAQLTGHVAIIGTEFADLHERFHKDAYANGCVSEDMIKSAAVGSIPTKVAENIVKSATKQQRVLDVIVQWVEDNKLENFSKSTGKPNAVLLSEDVGEAVSGHERDEAWYKYEAGKEVE